jgi:hypothetical protein
MSAVTKWLQYTENKYRNLFYCVQLKLTPVTLPSKTLLVLDYKYIEIYYPPSGVEVTSRGLSDP